MNDSETNLATLEDYLESLKDLCVDISRVKSEPLYEEKRGGFADVQVSTLDPGTPAAKLVAAKTIRLQTQNKEPERLAFRLARELKVWAGLQHPHILPLLGFYFGHKYNTAVLISEYMVYGDLKEYTAEQNPPWDIRLRLMRDFTDGLAYLHHQSPPISHGDLKMGNILVNAKRCAILTDLGLSKVLEDKSTGSMASEGLKGPIRYFSPELVLDKNTGHDLPSDIWAWAFIVLEALTDRMAYAEKQSQFSIIVALMNNELPTAVETLDIPVQTVKELLSKCWKNVPEERPSAEYCLRILDVETSAHQLNADDSPPASPRVTSPLSSPKADLRDLLDHHIECNGCTENIIGLRYQCANCSSLPVSYNLCAKCEKNSFTIHPFLHVFLKFNRRVDHPVQQQRPLLPVIYENTDDTPMELISNDVDYVHQMVFCDLCMEVIRGVWYRCVHCNMDLCGFHEESHDHDHVFIAIKAKVSMDVLHTVWDFEDASKNAPLIPPVFDPRK